MNLSRQRETENKEATMMRHRNSFGFSLAAAVLGGLLVWPAVGRAQLLPPLPDPTLIVTGPVGTLLGATAVLGGTGTIVAGTSDVLQASDLTGGIPSLLTGETLHAVTIGYPDQIDSDRKSTRLNSSHSQISYAVFCLKKKKNNIQHKV